jgi:hypothetical protein
MKSRSESIRVGRAERLAPPLLLAPCPHPLKRLMGRDSQFYSRINRIASVPALFPESLKLPVPMAEGLFLKSMTGKEMNLGDGDKKS